MKKGQRLWMRDELILATAALLSAKDKIKGTKSGVYSLSAEAQHYRFTSADCSNVKLHFFKYQ